LIVIAVSSLERKAVCEIRKIKHTLVYNGRTLNLAIGKANLGGDAKTL